MSTLSVIGCGHLGRTLARLWHEAGVLDIGDLLTRSPRSATAARDFVGAGRPLADFAALAPADIFLVATTDDALATAAGSLAASGVLRGGEVVFHASGATPSMVLAPLRDCGAVIGSVHPVLSFASPERALCDFPGSFCGVEGDESALAVLRPLFDALGARLFAVDADAKLLYHSAAVFACNYLPGLVECGVRAHALAGIDRATAMAILEPIVRGTLDNIFGHGPAQALSGPIARGDHTLVARQFEALKTRDAQLAAIYRHMATITLELSREQGNASPAALEELQRLLGQER